MYCQGTQLGRNLSMCYFSKRFFCTELFPNNLYRECITFESQEMGGGGVVRPPPPSLYYMYTHAKGKSQNLSQPACRLSHVSVRNPLSRLNVSTQLSPPKTADWRQSAQLVITPSHVFMIGRLLLLHIKLTYSG